MRTRLLTGARAGRLLAAALMLVGGGTAAPASAAAGPRILRAALEAQPGGDLNAAAQVRAGRRGLPAGRLSLWVTPDPRGSRKARGAVRLAESARPRLRRGNTWSVGAARLPDGVRPGVVRLVACDGRGARQRCSAPRTVRVVADVVTAGERIEADRAAGRLSEEAALVQQVLAVNGDPAAAPAYRGRPAGMDGREVMVTLGARLKTLSPTARRAVLPHVLRPTSPHSAYARSRRKPSRRVAARASSPRRQDRMVWDHRFVDGRLIKLWWPRDDARARATASRTAENMRGIMPRLIALMGRGPLSDAGAHRAPLPKGYEALREAGDGGDGALDVYVGDFPGWDYMRVEPYPFGCSARPASVEVKHYEPDGTTGGADADALPSHLAHELFHTVQFAFPRVDCSSRRAIAVDEASATWIEDLLFPEDDTEHRFKGDLTGVANHFPQPYQSWPFFWSVAKREGGPGFIRRIYEIAEREHMLASVDFGVSGGLKRAWPAYSLHAWNQEPISNTFHDLDRLPVHPEPPLERISLPHGGGPSIERHRRDILYAVSARYRRLVVVDPDVREIRFRNPYADVPEHGMHALLQLHDGTWRTEDWTGRADVRLCRDDADHNVSQLVLVETYVGYADLVSPRDHITEARNTCGDFPWHYKVLDASFEQNTTAAKPGGLCADFGGTSGSKRFTGTFASSQPSAVQRDSSGALDGRIAAHANAMWTDHLLNGCRRSGDGYVACSTRAPDEAPRNGGLWTVQVAVRASSANAETAELTWSLSNPSVGFFDAGDDECNVFEIVAALRYEDLLQDVPLAKLASKEPQTYTFSLSRRFDRTLSGEPATIDGTWSYTMTLQRVDEEGRPL